MACQAPAHLEPLVSARTSRTPAETTPYSNDSAPGKRLNAESDDSSESELARSGSGSDGEPGEPGEDLDRIVEGQAAPARLSMDHSDASGTIGPGAERSAPQSNGLANAEGSTSRTSASQATSPLQDDRDPVASSSRPRRNASSKAHLAWAGRAPDRAPRLLVEIESRKRARTQISSATSAKRRVGRPRKAAADESGAYGEQGAARARGGSKGGTPQDDSEESELASKDGEDDEQIDATHSALHKGKGKALVTEQVNTLERRALAEGSRARDLGPPVSERSEPYPDADEAPAGLLPRKRGRPRKTIDGGNTQGANAPSTPNRRASSSSASVSASKRKRSTPTHASTAPGRPTPSTPGGLSARSERGGKNKAAENFKPPDMNSLVAPTSSDAYFAAHTGTRSKKAKDQTSSSLLSSRLGTARLSSIADMPKIKSTHVSPSAFVHLHNSWRYMLQAGFSVLLHGVGETKGSLDDFASRMAREGWTNSVIVRGESVKRPEEILDAVEMGLGVEKASRRHEEDEVFATTLEKRASAINRSSHRALRSTANGVSDVNIDDDDDWLSDLETVEAREGGKALVQSPPLLLLIHNVSSAPLLVSRAQRALGMLSKNRRVWLLGSTSHVRAASLLDLHPEGPKWVLHALHTFIPREPSSRVAHSTGLPRALYGSGSSTIAQGAVGSTAPSATLANASNTAHAGEGQSDLNAKQALHIFKSVTNNAQSLFLKLAALQLQKLRSDEPLAAAAAAPRAATTYSELGTLAARNFIATNPGSLALVVHEFTSHGLLRSVAPDATVHTDGSAQGVSLTQSQAGALGSQATQGIGASTSGGTLLRLALDKDELEKAVQLCTAARVKR